MKNLIFTFIFLISISPAFSQEIEMTNDSINMLDETGKERVQLITSSTESSISLIGDSEDFPLVTLGTNENRKYGMLLLRDPESSTLIFEGFEGLNSDRYPLISLEGGDSNLLRLSSDSYDGDLQLYTRRDQAGLEIRRPSGSANIAQLRSDHKGRFGILELHNETNTGGITIVGGGVGGGDANLTTIIVEEDTSSIEIYSFNTEGRIDLGKKADRTYLDMTNGTIDLLTTEGARYVELDKDEFGGRLVLSNLDDTKLLELSTGVNGEYGSFQLLGSNGSQNILATSTSISDNHGYFSILNDMGEAKVDALAAPLGQGVIQIWGANGNANIRLTSLDGAPNRPLLSIHNTAGVERAGGYISVEEKGVLFAEDYSLLTSAGLVPTIYIDAAGQRVISGDVKNFSMDHPSQEGKEIWYACIEGPEVAAYARGTASLVHGEATVNLPAYFSEIVEAKGITVTITPLSADSKGISVVSKSVNEFSVKELFQGEGDYQFDWEIKAVRSGYEDYKVIRDKSKLQKNSFQNIISKSNEK